MIASRPTLLALAAILSGAGVAHAQFMPPASITDGMASRPAVRPVGAPVTYGAANMAPAAYPAVSAPTPAPAQAYVPAPYTPAPYAPASPTAGYPAYQGGVPAAAAYPAGDAAPTPAPSPYPATYAAPGTGYAGYAVPPPPPRLGPAAGGGPMQAPYAAPLITTATSERQEPAPLAPGYGYGSANGYADAGMGSLTPPSAPSIVVPPPAYAPLPQYSPGMRAPAPLPASYTDMARQSVAEGDYVRAQTGLEEAIKVNPFDPAALNNLAVAKAEQGQYNEAAGLLERATRLAPGDAEIAANLQRMRGYLNSYAMTGPAEPTPRPAASATSASPGSTLPPPPPPLWTRPGAVAVAPVPTAASLAPPVVYGPATGAYAGTPTPAYYPVVATPASQGYYTAAPAAVSGTPQGYYNSGVCENGVRRTARGTVEVCQPAR